jgi:anti-sigma regulatory factor (Ser/Thr protein kinase)
MRRRPVVWDRPVQGRPAAPPSRIKDIVLEICIDLESDPAMVRVVRQFVDRTASEWELDPVREDARLIATELAGNAVLHARTEFRVTLKSNGFGFLRIEVRDDNSRMPLVVGPPDGATSGRGLAVVSALATSWGTQRDGEGKIVWAELGHAGTADDPPCLDLSELTTVEDLEREAGTGEPAQG